MKVLFLDRDGVVNKDFGHVGQLHRFVYTDDFFENMRFYIGTEIPIIIVTNQAGIAKNLYSLEEHSRIEEKIRTDFARNEIILLDYVFCPHHPNGDIPTYRKVCACRKPEPGMLNYAKLKFNVKMSASALIGDKSSDIAAGISAGVGRNILVEKDNSFEFKRALVEAASYLKV